MKKLFTLIILMVVAGFTYFYFPTNTDINSSNTTAEYKYKEYAFKPYMHHLHQILQNQETESIPVANVLKARAEVDNFTPSKSSATTLNWQELGPNNLGGRTRAIVIDKDDPDRLYTGSVAGGMFLSEDRGETWTPYLDEDHPNFTAIASITQSSNGDIYVGTGEFVPNSLYGRGLGGHPFSLGSGIYKSTDRGATYQQLAPTTPQVTNTDTPYDVEWLFVTTMATSSKDPNTVFAGTNSGLYISYDGGTTWEEQTDLRESDPVWEVKVASDGRVYVLNGTRIYVSNDDRNFTDLTDNLGVTLTIGERKRLAISPTDPNTVYIVDIAGSLLNQVLQSKDGGNSWILIAQGGAGQSQFRPCTSAAGQCNYDLAIAVDATNPNRIFLGGIQLWSWAEGDGWEQISFNFGEDNARSPYYIHSDIHEICFDPHNDTHMYITTDGGVFKSENANTNTPSYESKNKGYNVTQFYSVGASYFGEVIGGTQDNGTPYVNYSLSSLKEGVDVYGGDGGYTEISKVNHNVMFVEYVEGQMVRSSNKGESFSNFFNEDTDDGGKLAEGAPFITSFFLYEDFDLYQNKGTDISSFFTGGNNGKLWLAPNVLDVSKVPVWVDVAEFDVGQNANRALSAMDFVPEPTSEKDGLISLYAVNRSGEMVRVTGLNLEVDEVSKEIEETYTTNNFTPDAFQGRYTSGLAVNPFNVSGEVYVSAGNYGNDEYIWVSRNAKLGDVSKIEFESIQSNLPKVPIHDIVFNNDPDYYIFAATEFGIWSYSKTTGEWTEQNAGIGRIPVHRIRIENMISKEDAPPNTACPILYAGTHGRGIFRSTDLTIPIFCNTEIIWNNGVGLNESTQLDGEIKVYPNPVMDVANVDLTLNTASQNTNYELYDLQGRMVKQADLGNRLAGKHQLSVEVNDLAAGNYMLRVFADGKIAVKQISVVK